MKNLYLTTALALIASPALADITPEEVWQSWQDTNTRLGMELTAGSQSREGAVLVLQDVTFTMDFGFFKIEQVLGEMRLEALEDGSVSAKYDTGITGTATMDLPDTPSLNIALTGRYEGAEGVAIGTANDYIFDFSVDTMQIDGTSVMGEESNARVKTASSSVSTGLSGHIHFTNADAGMNVAYTFAIDNLNSTQNTTRGEHNKQSQHTVAEGYSGEVNFFLPSATSDSTSGSLIPEGFTFDANIGVAHINMAQKTASPYFNMDFEADQQDAGASLSVDAHHITVTADGQKTFASIASPQFGPQPFRTDFANTSFALSLPYRPSDTPQDASFALSLGGVTASDNIWAFADPENTLSRTPADFEIATNVNATLLLDWTDIEAAKAWEEAPALLHKTTLERFLVAFENARIEGDGAVQYGNETGEPTPNGGALSFTLTGIPALLDKVGGLPLVSPLIIAQANGMLGIFTSAGEGDTLVSDIEFGEGGAVLVNGQRVK